MKGQVILVSAGPGNAGLMTLRGSEALRTADVVVYDRLVGEEILSRISPQIRKIDVGKQSGHHLVPQQEINAILVREAQAGNTVVRLKGGDNFLFGRGGEEVQALCAAGVPFEVVPGVTSALAAPAMAGIPVTHRDFCSSVHIVTAHARAGQELHIDFDALVRLNGTLVFLMGVHSLEGVLDGLLAAGLDAETPAAVVENGTRPSQRCICGTAADLAQRAREAKVKSPAVIVVGRVCSLTEELDWFTERPLFGRRIVVTRPFDRAAALTDRLREMGAEVIECPCIETVELDCTQELRQALEKPYDWAVFTSPAGVHAAVHALDRMGKDLRALYGMQLAVIGRGTQAALAQYGLKADLMPEQFDGVHLAQALSDSTAQPARALLLRAEMAGEELPRRLRASGWTADEVALYRTKRGCGNADVLCRALDSGTDFVTFISASTVEGFVQSVGDRPLGQFTALCIGEPTAAAAEHYGMRVKTAKNATIEDMIACLTEEI